MSRTPPSDDEPAGSLAPSQRRLQRPADFTGARLNRFSQVFLRHGLPGAVLGALCLTVPELRSLLAAALAGLTAAPERYLLTGLTIFGLLLGYAWLLDRRVDARRAGWILYLLAVSAWEEWVFRLAIPYYAGTDGAPLPSMAVASNVAFAAMHYFTLRWKWPWCLAALLGGLALSRQMAVHFDLALVIAFHWVATYLNTPRPPGGGGSGARPPR